MHLDADKTVKYDTEDDPGTYRSRYTHDESAAV